MKKTKIALLTLIVALLVSCNMPSAGLSPQANLAGRHDYLLVAPPGSTPTPTPFLPIPPTPLYLPTGMPTEVLPTEATPTPIPDLPIVEEPASTETTYISDQWRAWEDYAGPSIWPDIDIPSPMGILSHPEGQVNILLLGSDQRPDDGGFRTDTIQLLTVNPQEGTVKLTAFPRDLYVYIPGYTVQRINTAMGWGGFEALATTLEYNFGVRPDYYVLINFWSFKDVVDSIGGITVDAGQDLCDHRDGYDWYCVYAGSTWMDGETALWYVRSRYSTSDLDRGRRQQEVLDAIFDQLVNLDGILRAPELYEIYQQSVTTNVSFEFLANYLPIAASIAQSHEVGRYAIGDGEVYSWTNTSGAMVLVPMRDQVLSVMRQVISDP